MRGTHRWHQHHRLRRSSGIGHRAPGRSFRRRFATRDERIAHLETYLDELRAEAQAVEERVAELQARSNR